MIVAVISPHMKSGAGDTVVSMLLSKGLAGMNKKVLLTHTNPQSEAFYTYYGLQEYEDKTTTPSQLVKLLKAGAIEAEEVTDYCKSVVDGVDIFTNNETNFNDSDMLVFSEFIKTVKEYDFIIYEIEDMESKTAQYVLNNAEIIVLNTTQDVIDLKKFKEMSMDIGRMCKGKQTILLCNKYSKTVGTDKAVSKYLGLKTRCFTLHYNNWIRNACNNGRMVELYHTVKSKGSMVVELDKDIVTLSRAVSKAQTTIIKNRHKKRIEERDNLIAENIEEVEAKKESLGALQKLAGKAEKVIDGVTQKAPGLPEVQKVKEKMKEDTIRTEMQPEAPVEVQGDLKAEKVSKVEEVPKEQAKEVQKVTETYIEEGGGVSDK